MFHKLLRHHTEKNITMLAEYLDNAMQHAHVEPIEDGIYYGSIPNFQGVWSNATTEEACRQELREVLEGWILLDQPGVISVRSNPPRD